jgi:hypothetical protein
MCNVFRIVKSRRLNWTGHMARMGETKDAYRILVGNCLGERPLRKQTRVWEDNIKIYLTKVVCENGSWMDMDQDLSQWRTLV